MAPRPLIPIPILILAALTSPAAGQELETLVTDHFRLRSDLPAEEARARADLMEALYASFRRHVATPLRRAEPDVRLDVYVFATRDGFQAHVRRAAPGAEGSPGLFDVATRASYFFDFDAPPGSTTAREVLLHEVTHHLWWAHAGRPTASSARRALYWIAEGFANLFEQMDGGGDLHPHRSGRFERAVEMVAADRQTPFGTFEGFSQRSLDDPDADRRRDHHAQAMTIVAFLMEAEDGRWREALLETALEVERGKGSRTVFRKCFGKSLRSFEEDWKDWVRQPPPADPPPPEDPPRPEDPGPGPAPPERPDPGQGFDIRLPHRADAEVWRQVAAGGRDHELIDPAGVDEEALLLEATGSSCRTHRTDHYLLVGDVGDDRLAALGAQCERWYGVFEGHFGRPVDGLVLLRQMNMRRRMLGRPLQRNETMKVACFDSGSRYGSFLRKYFGGRMAGGTGYTDPETMTCVVRRSSSDLSFDATLAHEMGHLYVEAAFGRAVQGSIPPWLSEGQATYFEPLRPSGKGLGDVNGYRLSFCRSRFRVEDLLATDLDEAEGSQRSRFYGEAWALYHFGHHGPERFRRPFAAVEDAIGRAYFRTPDDGLREGARMFHEAFGDDLSELDLALREYVRDLKKR